MESRVTELEERLTHQEAALEALTRTTLEQQQALAQLGGQIEQVIALLRELAPSATGPESEEPPPPHY